jgi:dethiobiotin synthetase
MLNNSFFITSTGTNIGKTYCAVEIIKALIKKKIEVNPFKPILSGFNLRKIEESDSYKILRTIKKDIDIKDIKSITPWLFNNAMAPSLAAEKENKNLDYNQVFNWCLDKINYKNNKNAINIIEGAGGILVPIEKEKTILDLIIDLRIPVILVVGNYLGSVSHTLSVIKNIQLSKINIINIIINQNNNCDLDIDDTKKLIDTSLINKIIIRKMYKESNYESEEIQLITKDILSYFQY